MQKVSNQTKHLFDAVKEGLLRKSGHRIVVLMSSSMLVFLPAFSSNAASFVKGDTVSGLPKMLVNPATFSGSDRQNEATSLVININSLLRMTMLAALQLFQDYTIVRTLDGLSHRQVHLLIVAMETHRILLTGMLTQYARVRGGTHRSNFLAREIEQNNAKKAKLKNRMGSSNFSGSKKFQQKDLRREYYGRTKVGQFLESLRQNTKVGPGGTVQLNR